MAKKLMPLLILVGFVMPKQSWAYEYSGITTTVLGITILCEFAKCVPASRLELNLRVEDALVARATGEVTQELDEMIHRMRLELPSLAAASDEEIIIGLSELEY